MAPAEVLSGKVVSAYVPSALKAAEGEGGFTFQTNRKRCHDLPELSVGVCFLLAPSRISPGARLVVVRQLCAEISAQADAIRWNHCLVSVLSECFLGLRWQLRGALYFESVGCFFLRLIKLICISDNMRMSVNVCLVKTVGKICQTSFCFQLSLS